MTIIVDYREPKEISEILNFCCEKRNIDSGDYLVNNIAIERKTFHDFINSLFKGRLFDQLLRMKEKYSKCALILEGNIDINWLGNPYVFYNTTKIIQLNFGIPIILSESIKHTAEIILHLNKNDIPILFISDVKVRKINVSGIIQQNILTCIPKIGVYRAKNLLNHFRSLNNIFKSNTRELQKVDGINRKIAKIINEIICEEI